MNVAARLFLGAFGVAWFLLANINTDLGQQMLTWTVREWTNIAASLAGVLLLVLSCLPSRLLASAVVRWGSVPVLLFVECVIAVIAYRHLYYWQPLTALIAVMLGVLVALAATSLLWRRGHLARMSTGVP